MVWAGDGRFEGMAARIFKRRTCRARYHDAKHSGEGPWCYRHYAGDVSATETRANSRGHTGRIDQWPRLYVDAWHPGGQLYDRRISDGVLWAGCSLGAPRAAERKGSCVGSREGSRISPRRHQCAYLPNDGTPNFPYGRMRLCRAFVSQTREKGRFVEHCLFDHDLQRDGEASARFGGCDVSTAGGGPPRRGAGRI